MKPMLTLRERMRVDRRQTTELGEMNLDNSSVSTRKKERLRVALMLT